MNHVAALLSEARATADRASAAAAVSIRPLAAMDELVLAGGLFDQVWGLRQGARAFITKPVSEKDLLACINDLLPSST